jgi:hypothetical protein
MRVLNKLEEKVNKKRNNSSLFTFLLFISLTFLVISYCISPVLAETNEKKLSVILLNGEEVYVKSGSSHTFLQGYQLHVKGADPDGKKIWIELRREGIVLKDAVANEGSVFVFSQNSSEVLNLTVSTIYAGADGVLVKFCPVYQYLDPKLPAPEASDNPDGNSTGNNTSNIPKFENQAEGFDMSLFFVGIGTVLLVTGFFAGKRKTK